MKKRQIGLIKQRKSYREWQREWFGRWMKDDDTGEDREYKWKKKKDRVIWNNENDIENDLENKVNKMIQENREDWNKEKDAVNERTIGTMNERK